MAAQSFSSDVAIAGKQEQDQALGLASKYKGWIYLGTDTPTDTQIVPGGFKALQSIQGLQTTHVPTNMKGLDLVTAEAGLEAIDHSPRPLLITCGSSGRAGAMALIHEAVRQGTPAEEAINNAKNRDLKLLNSPALVDWVIYSINSLQHRRPPVFRQLFEAISSTYTYLLADPVSKEGVLIDPVDETVDRDIEVVRELGIKLIYAINTHCHADHITGTHLLKQRLPGLKSVISEASGARADVKVHHGDRIQFGTRYLECRATPGHTDGCMSFVLDDRSMVFTGDAVLIRGCGRTDFQQGNSETLYNMIHSRVFCLPDDTLLYPGHDYKGRHFTSVGEEKRFNPRLTQSLDGFVKTMETLNLPPPKKLEASLPRNLLDGAEE